MTCTICKTGSFTPGKTHFSAFIKDSFVVVKNVDALICDNCGDACYSADTARQMQKQVQLARQNADEVAITKI
ncbi:MAG: YgiT-type zinc finger protein [Bacteroidota bacterium]